MINPLAGIPLADLIDMVARLKAAESVLELLEMRCQVDLSQEQPVTGLCKGRTFLQEEAARRFVRMKELQP